MKQKDIITFLVLIFILVAAYVGSNIYHNAVTSTIPEILSVQVTPITPTFQTKILDAIKTRTKIAPLLNAPPVTPSPSAAPTPPTLVSPTPLQNRQVQSQP